MCVFQIPNRDLILTTDPNIFIDEKEYTHKGTEIFVLQLDFTVYI
jgi:hypothetical protein